MISKLFIQGEELDILSSENDHTDLELVAEYRIGGFTRGEADQIQVSLKSDNIIEFEFEDDSIWLSDPESMEELFPEGKVVGPDGNIVMQLPNALPADSQERGLFKDIAFKILRLFTRKGVAIPVRKLAENLEEKMTGGQFGLFHLQEDFELGSDKVESSEQPYLLFLHGTAASTKKSFDKLLDAPDIWRDIRAQYGDDHVLALQHRSLTQSPLQNVKDLVTQLPQSATLHLVSHSRGGLIGEILNRFCDGNALGFSEAELNYLTKHGRKPEVDLIRSISKIVQAKNIRVEKFIRVACGASGTTLASKRLDHVLNVIFNLIGIIAGQAANPVFIAFKNLLAAVVKTKDDVNTLPGLEVQNPDCPFLEMLNNGAPEMEINTPLIIISGNAKGLSSIKRALAVIVTRLFFSHDNDFVIDTLSMYNGAKRANKKVQFFFDEGATVSHFKYFENNKTRAALLLAIQNSGETLIPGFEFKTQVATTEEIRQAALKAIQFGSEFRDTVTGKKPIAVLLPGIMGSNLSVKDKSVWINYAQFLTGGLTKLEYSSDNNKNIRATSLVRTSYKKLADFLEGENYDVVTFPFDWRIPLNESARALNEKLTVLMSFGQPIKLIGHSMGGVLIRDFSIQHKDTWAMLNKKPGFRVLFLGSPLGGSFRIPYVLFGQDEIIKTLGKIDLRNSRKELIEVFNNMPGLLCLLPFTRDSDNDFSKPATWKKMRSKFEDKEWPLPSEAVLKEFGKYRDAVLSNMGSIDYSNAVYIAGQNRPGKETPLGYRFNAKGELEFLSTKAGDESVTWDSGIPVALQKQEKVYYSDVTHGDLANEKALFRPIADILDQGKTDILKRTAPALRSSELVTVSKPSFNFDFSEVGVERSILGLSGERKTTQGVVPVTISVSNGDLKYAAFPVLAGHFYKDGIFSAERSIDRYLNGELSRRLQLGLYPGVIGSNKILIAEGVQEPHFKGAIIAGLGEQGNLTAYQLMQTVEQAAANYLTGFNSKEVALPQPLAQQKQVVGISALIIGCGYGGLSIESSVRATIQGVQNANNKIRQIYDSSAITISEIEFIELLQDRALSCIHAISNIEKDEDRTLHIIWKTKKIRKRPGSRERLPVDNTSDWWTRINVRQIDETDFSKKKSGLTFTISTDAARESERSVYTGRETIMQLLDQMSKENQWSPQLAKTIFELLIPLDFKEQLKRQNNINWLVDKNTAIYPWELLQDSVSENAVPLSVSAGMIRQLATADFRININPVMDNTALVIGEPELEDNSLALPSALEEGKRVSALLAENNYDRTTTLLRSRAAEILVALFCQEYKILHMSGHGIFNEDPKKPTGMLIGKNAYLTTAEISQMSTVPELVFVNCCHLGFVSADAEALKQNRYKMAANIGTQLIEIGVKAVIVAGWAVDDAAALQFAEEFYRHLFGGDNFGDAVKKARRSIYQDFGHRTNTWGAYQCYGDPFYTLHTKVHKSRPTYNYVISEEAKITLTNLLNQLDTGEYDTREMVRTIEAVSREVDKKKLRTGEITELEAMLYAGLNQYDVAIEKFAALLKGSRSGYSGLAIEQYCNVRPKFYVSEYRKDKRKAPSLLRQTEQVIKELKALRVYGDTPERLNLLGSAYKRKAMMLGDKAKKVQAYGQSADFYRASAAISGKTNRFYALINWLSIENALAMAGFSKLDAKQIKAAHKKALNELQEELQSNEERIKSSDDTDYWMLVAEANLKLGLYQLGDNRLQYDDLVNSYTRVWKYVGHIGNRRSEIEHFEFLEDILALRKGAASKQGATQKTLLKNIRELRSQLEKLNTA